MRERHLRKGVSTVTKKQLEAIQKDAGRRVRREKVAGHRAIVESLGMPTS
jgi:hypothetical protein